MPTDSGKTEKTDKVLEGSGTAVLTVTGSGFGDQDSCQNSLEFGYNGVTAGCDASSSAADSFQCQISAGDMLLPEREHTLSLSVNNKGRAAFSSMDVTYYSAVSVVQSISGLEGSFGGGAQVHFGKLFLKTRLCHC